MENDHGNRNLSIKRRERVGTCISPKSRTATFHNDAEWLLLIVACLYLYKKFFPFDILKTDKSNIYKTSRLTQCFLFHCQAVLTCQAYLTKIYFRYRVAVEPLCVFFSTARYSSALDKVNIAGLGNYKKQICYMIDVFHLYVSHLFLYPLGYS